MTPIVVSTAVTLASSREQVWPLVADTDRMNRALGTEPVSYVPLDEAPTSARFVGQTVAGGLRLAYEERPFEWTHERSLRVVRRMRSGPLESYMYEASLEPTSDGGTRLEVRMELAPRSWLLRPFVQLQARRFLKRVRGLALDIDAHVRDHAPSPFAGGTADVSEARLAEAERTLVRERKVAPEVAAAVIDLVRTGGDADLARIRPFELAEQTGLDRREVLRAFLHAVTLGVFELRWGIVCPSCRMPTEQLTSMQKIGEAGHCHLCDITYATDLDRAVEATFVPHPAVRRIDNRVFCMGGPTRVPHVLAQTNADPGQERELEAPVRTGRYRLFARGGAVAAVAVEDGGPNEVSVALRGGAFSPASVVVAPGGGLRVENATDRALHLKLESLAYADLSATAHFVTTLGEFRRLFSNELLKPGTPLHVSSCTVFFSDLTGSTALYTREGDAVAFRFVDDHFDVLRAAIEAAGGTVVKTMGDAVMAAFVDPASCVRAAIDAQRGFEAFRRGRGPGGVETGLKIGLFSGPCYVITANGSIDYFGQTVNCASRVQHLAESGEIMLEEDSYERLSPAARAELRVVEHTVARVKGVEQPLRLVRATLLGAAADPATAALRGPLPPAELVQAAEELGPNTRRSALDR